MTSLNKPEEEVVSTKIVTEKEPLLEFTDSRLSFGTAAPEAKHEQEPEPSSDDTLSVEEEDLTLMDRHLDGIVSFLSSGSELDIYQLMAFRLKPGNNAYAEKSTIANWIKFILDIIRISLCVIIQIASIILLYLSISTTTERTYMAFCYNTTKTAAGYNYSYTYTDVKGGIMTVQPPLTSKLMATGFATILCVMFLGYFDSQIHSGFYAHLPYIRTHISFISSKMLHFGRMLNFLVLINAFALSLIRVYMTINVLNIILSSMAVIFIANIDSMVINSRDYRYTLKWFKNKNNRNWKKASTKEMTKCENFVFNFLYYTFRTLYYIFCLALFGVPVFFTVCY